MSKEYIDTLSIDQLKDALERMAKMGTIYCEAFELIITGDFDKKETKAILSQAVNMAYDLLPEEEKCQKPN